MRVLFEVIILLLLLGLLVIFIMTLMRGAPSVPTKKKAVRTMLRLANPKPGTVAADLGSGDGRLVLALARQGIETHGYEINPLLVLYTKLRISQAGLRGIAFAHWADFWRLDTSRFGLIVLFGIPGIMEKLGQKLERETKPGTRVVSNIFSFPQWTPERTENRVHRYTIGKKKRV